MKETPFEKKSCYDCAHIKEALSLWCGNKQAIKERGTSIPGCIHCPYWSPDWKYISKQFRTAENGYKPWWSKLTNPLIRLKLFIMKLIIITFFKKL